MVNCILMCYSNFRKTWKFT